MKAPKRSYERSIENVERTFSPGSSARLVVAALPREMDDAEFDAIWPVLCRVLLARPP